jgi:ADP-heptose:LPS heptosyltransferase
MDFFSLQKGDRARDLAALPADCRVEDLEAASVDFGDTALALHTLDLLISVDTSVAHLAGAFGRPVWTLLSEVPDWRWGLSGDTTPWYPSMRLFRQERRGDWAGVMRRVVEALVSRAFK